MKNIRNFFATKINQAIPLMAVFSLPCQNNEAIGECISQIYTVSLSLVGIVAFVQIVWGGFMLLTAAGNTSKTGQAMDKIKNAILGIVLLFSSYLILNTINPDLVNFKFNLEKIEKKDELAKPQDLATSIRNFDVNPKLADFKRDDALGFTFRVYASSAELEKVCPGEDTLVNPEVWLKKPPNTGTDSSVDIKIDSREVPKNLFGDGKVISFDFAKRIKETLETDKAITGFRNPIIFYATFSCNRKELNRSAPAEIVVAF
ncbi:MAG: pilin [Candidatus Taylorbacteria bacterium]|nr:pilin [Candidatus Taylorbacteria bacterium]